MDRPTVIVPLLPEHWPAVRAIYLEGIATGHATFETKAPEWEEWNAKCLEAGRLVALVDGSVAGWAALMPVSQRPVYAGVMEESVYVGSGYRGRGIGRRLLEHLVTESESIGVWTLQAGIFPENTASLRIHEQCGFRRVGLRRGLGRMGGRWRDVLLLERRSEVAGTD
ncbi:GNAT family N-acetyltransferase [Gaopeijia maritima]|uniref:GNAT family N-acetyltransferase n=1 Tax=Gaopeijia maritima TaxID=3119007 RepID=UPI0032792F64